MIEDFNAFSRLYTDNKLFELTSSKEGLYFLKLRSLARKEYYLRVFEKHKYLQIISKQKIFQKIFLIVIFLKKLFIIGLMKYTRQKD